MGKLEPGEGSRKPREGCKVRSCLLGGVSGAQFQPLRADTVTKERWISWIIYANLLYLKQNACYNEKQIDMFGKKHRGNLCTFAEETINAPPGDGKYLCQTIATRKE